MAELSGVKIRKKADPILRFLKETNTKVVVMESGYSYQFLYATF
jgi:hypothetical protein